MELIGIKEMAKILSINPSWLYSKTRTKEIPFYKIGKYVRFDPDEVLKWIKHQSDRE
jgi:excisionase family DNA binding protein